MINSDKIGVVCKLLKDELLDFVIEAYCEEK